MTESTRTERETFLILHDLRRGLRRTAGSEFPFEPLDRALGRYVRFSPDELLAWVDGNRHFGPRPKAKEAA